MSSHETKRYSLQMNELADRLECERDDARAERDAARNGRQGADVAVKVARAERDHWIKLWNRLEAAISHHKAGKSAMFVDEIDEALYAARDKILKSAARGTR